MKDPMLGPISYEDCVWLMDQLAALGFRWNNSKPSQEIVDRIRRDYVMSSIWYYGCLDKFQCMGSVGAPIHSNVLTLTNSARHFVQYLKTRQKV